MYTFVTIFTIGALHRWTPAWTVTSRFGIDCKDPRAIQRATELLSRLRTRTAATAAAASGAPTNHTTAAFAPCGYEVGMHFHFASSTVGGANWWGLAEAFLRFCADFSALSPLPVTVVDFGGGWNPYYMDGDHAMQQLTSLLGYEINIFLESFEQLI